MDPWALFQEIYVKVFYGSYEYEMKVMLDKRFLVTLFKFCKYVYKSEKLY